MTLPAAQLTKRGTTSGLMRRPLTALAIWKWSSVGILINTAPFILAPNALLHSAIQARCDFRAVGGANYWLLWYQPNTTLQHIHLKGSSSLQQKPIKFTLPQSHFLRSIIIQNNLSMIHKIFLQKFSVWKPKCLWWSFRKKQDSVFTSVTPCQSDSELHDFKYSTFCAVHLHVIMLVEFLMLHLKLCSFYLIVQLDHLLLVIIFEVPP